MKYTRVVVISTLTVITIVLTGCFSSRPENIEAFLKPQQVDVTTDTYILQPPDEVMILCSKVPEINEQRQRIRPDGKISFENLGEIQAAGKTPEEVAQGLRKKALELYRLEGESPAAYTGEISLTLGGE